MAAVFDPNRPRDADVARALRSYALTTVDANLRQILLRTAAEYDAAFVRPQAPATT